MAHKNMTMILKLNSAKLVMAQMDKMAPMVDQKNMDFETKNSTSKVIVWKSHVLHGRNTEKGENKLTRLEIVAWNLCNIFFSDGAEEMMRNASNYIVYSM